MYLAFVKRSKYTTALSAHKIRMARHCVVELFCVDPIDAYQYVATRSTMGVACACERAGR